MSRDSRMDLPLSRVSRTASLRECFLHLPRESVEIAGALVTGERSPCGECGARGFYCGVDGGGVSGGDLGEEFAGGGVPGVEGVLACAGPLAVDVVAEGALVGFEPLDDFACVFGGWAVFHAVEFFYDAACHS